MCIRDRNRSVIVGVVILCDGPLQIKTVSYTHLDVYKRQMGYYVNCYIITCFFLRKQVIRNGLLKMKDLHYYSFHTLRNIYCLFLFYKVIRDFNAEMK